jgi:hypothetical protein
MIEELKHILTILAGRIQASPYGSTGVSLNHGLHFTGGEPFLNFELLRQGVEMAHQLGIPSLFVETNAFWCRNEEETLIKMRQLKEAGLSGMLVSVNPFILESVPFQRTARAIQLGMNIFGQGLVVYQIEYFQQFRKLSLAGRMKLDEYIRRVGLREATGRIELLPIGRAVYTLTDWFRTYPASTFFGAPCTHELSRTYHNHWDNYGNVLPGFCSGIALGNLCEQPGLYEEGLDLKQEYPLLKLLLETGVEGLYHFAQTHFGYQELTTGYVSQCHLCVDIRRHIVNHTQEFKELRPIEFYDHISNFSVNH